MRLFEFNKTVKYLPGLDFYKRFNHSPANRNIFSRFRYLQPRYLDEQEILYTMDDKKVTGVAGLQKSPSEDDVYWIMFVEIDPQYRNQGLAKQLIEEIFRIMRERNANIRNSSYSVEGETYIKRAFERMQKKYPDVGFKEAGDHTLFQENI